MLKQKSYTLTPLVSVVIPAFNVKPYIRAAIDSVLSQTWKSLELIVVDDGSSDGTWEQLLDYSDPRLRRFQQKNAGSSAARNSGIAEAKGSYIAFLDGDDLWAEDKLERHIRYLEANSDCDLTFSRSEIVDEHGRPTGRFSSTVAGVISFEQLLIENVVNNGSAAVLRRSALDQAGWFDASLQSCVDWDLWLRIASLRALNVVCVEGILTKYRMREGQITKNWRRMESGWLTVFGKAHIQDSARANTVAKAAHAKLYRYLAYIAYESRDFQNSWKCLVRAFQYSWAVTTRDRRTWILASALSAHAVLPASWHHTLAETVRRLRSRSRGTHTLLI